LLDKKPAITLNEVGLTDNSSTLSIGLILWEDITDIKVTKVLFQKRLLIVVRNPNKYLSRSSNPLKKLMARSNIKFYKTPIIFPAQWLLDDVADIRSILISNIRKNEAGHTS